MRVRYKHERHNYQLRDATTMYIFGYGSLINSASRKLTGQTGEAIPVIAHGLVRYLSLIHI